MFAFTPGCCCEGGVVECSIVSDDFNRANNTNVGANWTETAGDWEIDSNEAEISTANALLVSTGTNPDGGTSQIQALVKASSITTLARIIVAYTDSNNYLYAELLFLGGSSTLRLMQMSGGTPTQLARYGGTLGTITLSTATQYLWTLCYDGEVLTTVVGAATYCLSAGVTGFTGNKVALGTGGTVIGDVNFDDVAGTRVRPDCTICTPCGNCTTCCNDGGPFEFVVDFDGMTATNNECSDCASLPTEYTLPTYTTPGVCVYRYYEQYCEWPCGAASPGTCGSVFELVVQLSIDADCKPTVTFNIAGARPGDACLCPSTDEVSARYEGSDGDMSGDCAGPITLNLISSGDEGNSACDITFPATITLSAA